MFTRRQLARLIPWALLLVGGVGLAHAQDVEFDTALDQARVYIKKKWYREAIKQLRRAITSEEGQTSYEAHILLAQSCFREHDIGCALKMTERARTLARGIEQKRAAQNVLEYLRRNFGKVEFQAGPGELSEGYLELERLDPILDKDIKAYYKDKVEPLADQRRSLPWIMYLPSGRYRLYGQEFVVEGGKEMLVNAGFNAENAKPKPEKKPPPPRFEGVGIVLEVRAGAGLSLATSSENDSTMGAVADVTAGYAITSRLGVGAFAKFNYDLGATSANGALTYGALATLRVPLAASLAATSAIGYGLGEGPAARFSNCLATIEEQSGKEVLLCADATDGSGNVAATLATRMHGPVLRAGLAYERASKNMILTGSLGLQAHYAIVGSVEDGTGHYVGYDAMTIAYRAGGAVVHPLRVELLAGANLTF